ncbi:hypothetical protein EV138_1474 [Kribbella voronezhensis]|uniref:Peptidase inhibitor family I36 n=1 Tax=Kribbella voronezhensis TaxID=2512212 RepID=A0A4R7T9R0_9ACTN|nr:hypothetical protein [Kribbella voronezhensis]TDU87937.1 hypothetical protein EV138_1474 [Kribbella voronezhensis]
MQIRKLRPVAVVLLAAGAAAVGTALPASAGSYSSCGTERVCLYENNYFNDQNTDHWRDFNSSDADLRNNYWKDRNGSDSNDHMDNETSSIKVNGCSVTVYQDVNYGGAQNWWGPGQVDGKLADNAIGDNRISALRVTC